jgi:hypothetical protein
MDGIPIQSAGLNTIGQATSNEVDGERMIVDNTIPAGYARKDRLPAATKSGKIVRRHTSQNDHQIALEQQSVQCDFRSPAGTTSIDQAALVRTVMLMNSEGARKARPGYAVDLILRYGPMVPPGYKDIYLVSIHPPTIELL